MTKQDLRNKMQQLQTKIEMTCQQAKTMTAISKAIQSAEAEDKLAVLNESAIYLLRSKQLIALAESLMEELKDTNEEYNQRG